MKEVEQVIQGLSFASRQSSEDLTAVVQATQQLSEFQKFSQYLDTITFIIRKLGFYNQSAQKAIQDLDQAGQQSEKEEQEVVRLLEDTSQKG